MGEHITSYLDELKRIFRVSDMMVTTHAILKKRYSILSIVSDIILFMCATVLCIVIFASEDLLIKYFSINYPFYIGIFSLITILYSLIANLLNWKVVAERHTNAFKRYYELKSESKDIIRKSENNENVDISIFIAKYNILTSNLISVPENLFNKCKKKHRLKIFISKYLDRHPGVSLLSLKIRIWFKDNFKPLEEKENSN